ncbi:ABC transporter permease [Butyrivibrio sp. AC2005]|uniref:ABC transporter permease n=1 Tax=Butyrivibrio sp. AC2005 TaxID=1280672 RepID=UPI0003F70CF2|nr:ABC transporter permease subunit [Butyrivibrio sp. AC2005]
MAIARASFTTRQETGKAVKSARPARERKYTKEAIRKDLKRNWKRYLLIVPLILFYVVFAYMPMGGILMAFSDYKPKFGIFGSLIKRFVGLENFTDFFGSFYFWRLMKNTILLNGWSLLISFPLTIILALLINDIGNKYFKKTVQTLSYLPYFISMVVVCGIVVDFCKTTGVLGTLMTMLTGKSQNLLGVASYWRTIYISSDLWQGLGFGTILYIAALSGVDKQQYEAAKIDGAGHWQQLIHVTLPGISQTIIIMLILRVGMLMASSYEKTILMYNSQIYDTADIIASYVYRKGLMDGDYSYSTAVGLFNSVINLVLIMTTNKLSRKYTETSLF